MFGGTTLLRPVTIGVPGGRHGPPATALRRIRRRTTTAADADQCLNFVFIWTSSLLNLSPVKCTTSAWM